jgi:6-phosphogluconolactonase
MEHVPMKYITSVPALVLFVIALLVVPVSAADLFVYFGTHGSGDGIGFSLAHFDTDTGKLTTPVFLETAVAPAYFIISPDGRYLYTCNSAPGASVSAYAIDPVTGNLTLLNQKPSDGGDPSYVTLDKTGRYLMLANFAGGSIASYALLPDGSLGEMSQFIQHDPEGVDDQTVPHAHCINMDPRNKFALSADLGLDKLFVYHFNSKTGTLTPNDPPFAKVATGLGPRHIVFSRDGRFVYLITQMGSSIIRFGWDPVRGALTQYESVSTLPAGLQTTGLGASEIVLHSNGKFLYVTNRGHNSVGVFSVDQKTGRLTWLQDISTEGETPRDCDFDPTGHWLIVTNEDSDNALIYSIDQNTGILAPVGEPIEVRSPFCARFLSH